MVVSYLKEPTQLPNGDAATNGTEDLEDPIRPNPRTGQVLSLRTQTNGQTQLLYSGLQQRRNTTDDEGAAGGQIDALALPNGFELTDFAALNGGTKTQKLGHRSFGEVFGLPVTSRVRQLEEPRPSKNSTRATQLKFVPSSGVIENSLEAKEDDYKYAKLPTGFWISYGTSNSQNSSQSTANDFASALRSNEVSQPTAADDDALFPSVYSSFAPTSDNTKALIPSEDMGQYWWRKSGRKHKLTMFTVNDSQELGEDGDAQGLEDFDNLLENWVPGEDEAFPEARLEENKDNNDLLEEVSELIETLSSYQRSRSLAASGHIPEPSEAEFDTFEMLRTQLRLLVDALPPFAMAKLNGDQLEELNISTKLLVEAPEFAGTGQLDEYASSRQRASVAATAAANRPVGAAQVRPTYVPPQTSTPAFNVQARTYNASVPATAAYGMRATTNYQTPTAARAPYSQTPYQSQNTPFSNRATIQQYQRQLQNGLGNYATTQAQTQTPSIVQRPTQPGYQQRAQDSAMATVGRSVSPQKPLANGQTYTPRALTQNQYPYQRPNSGTPVTPSYASVAGAVTGRYDGTAETTKSEFGGVGGGQVPAKSQSPAVATAAMSQSQTVEVSR